MITKTDLWNWNQFLAEQFGKRPIGCQCKDCEPGNTFKCAVCKRLTPWCFGADDGDFDLCDSCWCDKYREDKEEAIA